MTPVLLDPSAGAVILMTREGKVLAWSDPADLAGRSHDDSSADVDLWDLIRGDGTEDLAAALTASADDALGTSPTLHLVRPARELPTNALHSSTLRLELRRIGEGIIMGVLSDSRLQAGARTSRALSQEAASLLGRETLAAVTRVWGQVRDAMVLTTPDDRPEGPVILAANEAFHSLFEVGEEEARGGALGDFLSPANPGILEAMRGHVIQGAGSISDLAVVKRTSGGPTLVEWELAAIHGADGSVLGLFGVLREAGRTRSHRRRSPDIDPLTGLPNQLHFISRLQRSIERAAQDNAYTLAIVGLELRELAEVERRLGTMVSNAVLEALARRLRQSLRAGDLIARIGDRRLAILLDHFGPWSNLDAVLDRIRGATADPYTIAGEHISLTVVGAAVPVSNRHNPRDNVRELMDEVEEAVSRGSALGALKPWVGGVRRFRGGSPELAEAMRRGQLRLQYLPMVAVDTGRPVGLEALLRWEHPERGLIPGAEFVGDAERTRLILPIGQWVIQRVFQDLRTWQAELPVGLGLPVHVNLSASEFWTPDLGSGLIRETREAGADPARLQLEVPEAALYRNPLAARRVLRRLEELGFDVWLDRFGEGGLHLRDLSMLPIRRVKVSSECAWGFEGGASRRCTPLLRSLRAMAHEFGWKLAVSGVETDRQRDALRDLGCEVGQGFFFAHPLAPADTVAHLRQAI